MSVPAGLEIRGDRSPPGKPTRGRGLFATRSFAPGEEIAVFSKPLLVLPAGPDAATCCNYCLDPRRQPVKLCTGCRAVAYCGAACQRAHWSRVHKVECRALQAAFASAAEAAAATPNAVVQPLPTPVRALMLLMLQWTRSPEIRAAVGRLESNTAAFVGNAALWDDFKMQAAAACKFASWFGEEQIKTAIEVLCRVHTNAFDRCERDLGHSGLYLDPALSMANHACLPNAVVGFAGQKAYLRAQEPISAGAEVTISYIDFNKPRAARQRELVHYNFVCTCPRCAADLDVYQACQQSPVLALNRAPGFFSLVPNLDLLRNPPVLRDGPHAVSARQIDDMYAACQADLLDANPDRSAADRLRVLRRMYRTCRPLIDAGRWAVEPLPQIFVHAIMHCIDVGNHAHLLVYASFAAQHIDPYKFPTPCAAWRVKSCLTLAKSIPHTLPIVRPEMDGDGGVAAKAARGQGPNPNKHRRVHPGVIDVLPDFLDGAVYLVLLMMVLHNGPLGHSPEWPPLDDARRLLSDFQTQPNHEPITAVVNNWLANPSSPEMVRFFDERVLRPISRLSALAPEILEDLVKQ